jgi:hypothetical protein
MSEKDNLEKLIDYKKGFSFSKLVVVISIAAVVVISVFAVVLIIQNVKQANEKVYVLSPKGQINKAIQVNRNEVRKYEYQAVMKNVFRYLYEHDEHNFKRRLELANNILGKPGVRITKEFKKENHLKRLREYNILLRIQITDFKVNMKNKTGMIKGVQSVIWGKETKKIKYAVKCKFRDMLGNSVKNPHGIKIIRWEEVVEKPINK